MDRAEVRILRVEIAPGASRQVQLAVGSERPVEVDANQAQFFKANTPHGWRNAGTVQSLLFSLTS
jgi:hypothetical protein